MTFLCTMIEANEHEVLLSTFPPRAAMFEASLSFLLNYSMPPTLAVVVVFPHRRGVDGRSGHRPKSYYKQKCFVVDVRSVVFHGQDGESKPRGTILDPVATGGGREIFGRVTAFVEPLPGNVQVNVQSSSKRNVERKNLRRIKWISTWASLSTGIMLFQAALMCAVLP